MKRLLAAAALFAALFTTAAHADCNGVPSANYICASPNGSAGPVNPRAMVGADLPSSVYGTQSANTAYMGPSSGSPAAPGFRALVGTDLPSPGASSLGGVRSLTCATHTWLDVISTSGVPACAQPNFSDLAGNISTSQMNSGTGASSSTYFRGDGTWAAPVSTLPAYNQPCNPTSSSALASNCLVPSLSSKAFGATGLTTSTTGTISASSTTLTLASALDFANGNGIRVNGAGTTFSLPAPTSLTITPTGTTGSTAYAYTIASLDASGGVGVAITTVTTSTGNATLSATNYNALSWTAAAGASGYAIYGNKSGSLALIGVVSGTTFNDLGGGAVAPPDWLPTTPLATAQNDYLVTTISSGAGTTSLTLAAAASNSVTSKAVDHDDTTALGSWISACQSGSVVCFLDNGIYNITSALSVTSNIKVLGAGRNTSAIQMISLFQNGFAINTPSFFGAMENLGVYGAGVGVAASNWCINVTGSSNNQVWSFRHMYLNACYNGINFANAVTFLVDDSYIASTHIHVQCSTCGDSIIHANWIASNTATGIGVVVNSSGLKLVGNKINLTNAFGGVGVLWTGQAGANQSVLIIDANSIEVAGSGSSSLGIQMAKGSATSMYNVVMSGNEIAAGDPLMFNDANTGWLYNVTANGNTLIASGGACAVFTTVQNFDISGNVCYGVNSATYGFYLDSNSSGVLAGNKITGVTTPIVNNSSSNLLDDMNGLTFSQLPSAAANGSRLFITNAAPASSPCTGSSTGSTAFRQNGAWKCF